MKKSILWAAGVGVLAVLAVSVTTIAMRGNDSANVNSGPIGTYEPWSPTGGFPAIYMGYNILKCEETGAITNSKRRIFQCTYSRDPLPLINYYYVDSTGWIYLNE